MQLEVYAISVWVHSLYCTLVDSRPFTDPKNAAIIVENQGIGEIIKCLSSPHEETVLSAITTLYYLLGYCKKGTCCRFSYFCLLIFIRDIATKSVVECMVKYAQSKNTRLKNIATIFVQDLTLFEDKSIHHKKWFIESFVHFTQPNVVQWFTLLHVVISHHLFLCNFEQRKRSIGYKMNEMITREEALLNVFNTIENKMSLDKPKRGKKDFSTDSLLYGRCSTSETPQVFTHCTRSNTEHSIWQNVLETVQHNKLHS